MKIYLHIGTEKTGSSHLQSVAAINRKRLIEQGIWFPEAGKRESQLIKGEISAGNAQNLTDALNSSDFDTCSEIIAGHLLKAKEYNCHSLFLSNELLVLALAGEERLKQLQSVFKRNGCSEARYLLFLRDPVDGAISLYKHRAKRGTAPDIEKWPQKHYLYGTGLLSFFKHSENERIDLTCRKFSKKEGALEEVLFQEWLGTDIELSPPPAPVNPSLSLSELRLLKKVRRHQPYLANILYERLLAVGKGRKAEQTSIDQYHRDVLSNYLNRYEETWNVCNAHLPESEKLLYPAKVDKKDLKSGNTGTFSDAQMDEIAGIIADSISFRFKLHLEWLKWRGRIVKLKNNLLK